MYNLYIYIYIYIYIYFYIYIYIYVHICIYNKYIPNNKLYIINYINIKSALQKKPIYV